PKGEVHVVYFSSISNNTHRFIQKLGVNNSRVPYDLEEELNVNSDYVLITPTYSGGGESEAGAVPGRLIKFLDRCHDRPQAGP
ncbi:class Ib ribonucleoside-diphosphate reductase assembly flavoprotein NrdI, partial [Rhizobium sp. KAs_5_22]